MSSNSCGTANSPAVLLISSLRRSTAGVGVTLCSLSRSDCIANQASCSGTKGLNVCSRDSLPLHSSSLKRHWWWWQRVNFVSRGPAHSPVAISNSPRDSNHIVDCCSVPPVLLFCPPDLSHSEYNLLPSPRSTRHCCFSHAQPHSKLVSGIHSVQKVLRISVSPANTPSYVGFLPCNLLNGVRPSRPFWHLDKMLPTCSTNHGKIGESFRSSSCVQLSTWHLVVLMTPRNNITASSTNTFGSFDCILRRNPCVAILSDTISEREYCRHCATFQRDIFVYPDELINLATLTCPRFFNSLLQNYAAHHVLVSVLQCTSLTHLVSSESSQLNLA